MFGGSDNFSETADLLNKSLTNVALYTGVNVLTSVHSQAKVSVIDLNTDKELPDDPLIKLLKNPNPFQSQRDFLKQLYWFKLLGTNVMRSIRIRDNGDVNDINNIKYLYNLIPSCINWQDVNKVDKMIISDGDYEKLLGREIKYTIGGKTYPIKISDLEFFYDIANGMTDSNAFRSQSRLHSVIPAINNIEEAQRAKNINLKFSAKFLASNKNQMQSSSVPFRPGEREEIAQAFHKNGIIPSGADIDLKSLAQNFNQLMYDDQVNAEATKIFSVLGINKEIINWYAEGQSTYENQKVSIPAWIQNTIQSEANDVAGTLTNAYNYLEQGKEVRLTFNHLPAMKYVELEKVEFIKKQAETIKLLVDSGATFESAVAMLGIDDLKISKNEQ